MYFSRDCVGHTESNIYILCIQILKYFYIITSPTNGGTLNALFNALLYNVSPSYVQVLIERYMGLEHLQTLVSTTGPGTSPLWITRDDYTLTVHLSKRNPEKVKYNIKRLAIHPEGVRENKTEGMTSVVSDL